LSARVGQLLNLVDSLVPKSLGHLVVGRLVFARDELSRGLAIAAGRRGEVLIEVMKVDGEVYIPASSVKGALRRLSESIARSAIGGSSGVLEAVTMAHCELEDEGVVHLCHDISPLYEVYTRLSRDDLEALASRGLVPRDKVEELWRLLASDPLTALRRLEPLTAQLCTICRLFGGPGLAGKFKVTGVQLLGSRLSTLTHIMIDRERRTVSEGALYVEEFAVPEALTVEFIVENAPPGSPEYDLLLKTLRALEHVVLTIGHSKSRGLGWFRLAKDKSQLLLIDLNKATKPQELIEMLTRPEQYAERVSI
jgi:CRISPR/Cas system CSM-associated protein Csm3 (group 7 of RAMP superfamily)